MSKLRNWAEREIELAKKREMEGCQSDEWMYGCCCYDSALKAFNSLCDDEHSGMSIQITKSILNRLIDGKPLTPIEDTEDIWNEVWDGKYQCKRMSSLFKTISKDGTVSYHDNNRTVMIDTKTGTGWHNGKVSRYIDDLHPITMPYIPTDKPYKVFCEDFCYLKPDAVGEYDHFAMLYMQDPEGNRTEINKYYEETKEGFAQISCNEYLKRKQETEDMRCGSE